MAKSPKSRKPAPRAPVVSAAALRTTALRVGFGLAAIGLGAGLYAWHGRRAEVAVRDARPAVAAVQPAKLAETPRKSEPAPAAPPRREASSEAFKPMSAALRASFDAWLMAAYAKCWRAPRSPPDADPYLPKVRVAFRENGELAGPPKLINPPSDPALRPQAEAALKAVKGCDPLHVPDKYAEYYPSWKTRTVYFDPTRN